MKKILVIPHHPASAKVRIRLTEMAKALAHRGDYDVYYLNWRAAEGDYSLFNRVMASILDLCKLPRTYRRDSITHVEFPTLHRPVFLARRFNRFMLQLLLARERFDVIINGSYYLFSIDSERRRFAYIVDLADLPPASPRYRFVDAATGVEARIADVVTVVSHGLVDYVNGRYERPAVFLPNGTNIAALRAVTADTLAGLREQYRLAGKYVIGYIGYIGEWVDIELAIESFRLFQNQVPDAVLLWIGAAPDIERLRTKYGAGDVLFTGGIERRIEDYFNLIDLGILPHRVSPFQDMAFHIKLVEYTAARKPVVSARLKESMRLAFPNVLFPEANPASWADSLLTARSMHWQNEWDSCVEQFDWKHICDTFDSLIKRS